MSAANPTIYVDLIEERPLEREQWLSRAGFAVDTDPPTADAAYEEYLDNFQPWRLLVKSGDNHRALFRSTERYYNEADARHAAEVAFGAQSNVFLRRAEHGNETLRVANTGGGA